MYSLLLPLARSTPAILVAPGRWFPLALHLIWAVLLLGWPDNIDVTALDTHRELISNDWVLAAAFITASSLVIVGTFYPPHTPLPLAVYILPQQYLVCVSAAGALHAMWIGRFADGVERGTPFLIADQVWTVLVALLHTWVVAALFFAVFRLQCARERGECR